MSGRFTFRGKRLDNGEWLEGSLCNGDGWVYIVYDDDFYESTENGNDVLRSDRYFQVDPDTIGQCTGLTDKNGNLIFEGDILKFKDYARGHNHDNYFCKVVWQDNIAGFDGKGIVNYRDGREWKQKIDHMLPSIQFPHQAEIVGNVTDNPELLGGE